ncbi:MAG: hypothetical protein D084_Lepto4C00513G0010 [Leptospirillum sp. Group IV 'UBA BS']|nr:MAG: hypothetical protein D084_Lepto4C00513G0010 [Leptospirillum sp. Group IV 'UBA BS']
MEEGGGVNLYFPDSLPQENWTIVEMVRQINEPLQITNPIVLAALLFLFLSNKIEMM